MRLKDIREEHDLTQFTMSKHLGISRSIYSLWEIDKNTIPMKRLIDFCLFFNVSIDYTLGYNKTPQYPNSKKEINIELSKKRIKRLRKLNKFTQEDLGKKFSINRSLISKYEKGSTLISTTFLIECIKLYKISGDYLLGLIDEPIKVYPDTTVAT